MAAPTSPVLVTPDDKASVVGNVIQFLFTVPSDTDNDLLVFRIELDTLNSFSPSNPNYKVSESRFAEDKKTNGHWQVKQHKTFGENSIFGAEVIFGEGTVSACEGVSNYIDIPPAGIGSSYYGKNARVILRQQDTSCFPTTESKWYWRISASDGLNSPALFNQFIFGQAVLGRP